MIRTVSSPSAGSQQLRVLRAVVVCILLLVSLAAIGAPAGAQATCRGLEVTVDISRGELPTAGDDVILGTPDDDAIAAGEGNDTICGGAGDDQIWGQGGADMIYGGPGDDRLRGGDGDDDLRGEDGVDNLAGGRDDDFVDGGNGNDDAVRGGTGDDDITGGPGDDRLVAGNGGVDTVRGGDGDDELVTGGPRPDTVIGGSGNDVIKGHKGADTLEGGSGDDALFGGPQPDLLTGGDGTDECNGGTEDDIATTCEALINIETPPPVPTPFPTPTPTPTPTPAASISFIERFDDLVPTGSPYSTFVRVTDDTGTIGIDVPTEFTFVDTTPSGTVPTISTGTIEGGGLEAPAINMRSFAASDGFAVADLLAENAALLVADCSILTSEFELPAPSGLDGLLFADSILVGDISGAYVVYEACQFGASPIVLIEVALTSATGRISVMTFTVLSSADLDLVDRVLTTVDLG